jgi:hypothetical protein
MSGLILPGHLQQQPTQLGFQILEQGPNYVLVIVCAPSQFVPMPPGPLEQIEGFATAILDMCQKSREQKQKVLDVVSGNGSPNVRMVE